MTLQKLLSISAALYACAALAAPVPNVAYTWDSVAIGGGGFVSAVIPSRSEAGVVYARTDVGGAYRWDKTKARWLPLLDWVSDAETGFLGVDSLAIDPKNAAKIYLLAGISYQNGGKTAILRSSDYGKTFSITDVSAQFKTHGNGMGRQNGERLAVDPGSGNLLYAGTRADGLFRSGDAGASWTRMPSLDVDKTPNGVGISFVLPDPASVADGVARRLLVGVSRYGTAGPNLYRSDDAGASFSTVPGAPSGLMPQRAALDGDGNVVLTFANGAGPHPHRSEPEPMNKGQVWKYKLGDGSWTNITPAGITLPFAGVTVDRANGKRIVVSTINTYMPQGDARGDRIYISSDGGASWTDVIARGFARDAAGVSWIGGHAIHWAGSIEFDPFNSKALWVTSGNGIFKTANIDAAPTTWTFDVKGLEETVPLDLVSIPGGPLVSAIGDYDGFRHADVTRYSPIHSPQMGTTTGLDVAAAKPAAMVRVGGAIYTTADGGASWSKAAVIKGDKGQVAMSANGGVILHSPERSNATWRTADAGASWTAVAGLAAPNLRPVADPVNPDKFYAYDNGVLRVSLDGGKAFAPAATLAAGGSKVLRAAPGREGDVWVALRAGGLARSTDSGASFSTFANVSHCGAVGFGKAAAGAPYPAIFIWGTVGGVRGAFRSTDTGATWVRINDDAHQYGGPGNGQFIMGDMNAFGVVYMSTAGRGIVYGKPKDK
jgi:xyloglucan-specific exo-beta-1,4-glucanase